MGLEVRGLTIYIRCLLGKILCMLWRNWIFKIFSPNGILQWVLDQTQYYLQTATLNIPNIILPWDLEVEYLLDKTNTNQYSHSTCKHLNSMEKLLIADNINPTISNHQIKCCYKWRHLHSTLNLLQSINVTTVIHGWVRQVQSYGQPVKTSPVMFWLGDVLSTIRVLNLKKCALSL